MQQIVNMKGRRGFKGEAPPTTPPPQTGWLAAGQDVKYYIIILYYI